MRFAFFCSIVAALMFLTQNANAQYAREGATLENINGVVLSDQDIINLVGNDIFEQTVVGARKQYKAGTSLITGSIFSISAGLSGLLITSYKVSDGRYRTYQAAFKNDGSILALYLGSEVALALGWAALNTGITLKTIGMKRLDWVSEECNKVSDVSFHVGAAPHGMGLTLRF